MKTTIKIKATFIPTILLNNLLLPYKVKQISLNSLKEVNLNCVKSPLRNISGKKNKRFFRNCILLNHLIRVPI